MAFVAFFIWIGSPLSICSGFDTLHNYFPQIKRIKEDTAQVTTVISIVKLLLSFIPFNISINVTPNSQAIKMRNKIAVAYNLFLHTIYNFEIA